MVETTVAAPATPATEKKAKKEGKPRKPKSASSHPKVAEMVTTAIEDLREKGGSSLQAIKKYISVNYKVDIERISIFVRRYLKSAVASGALVQTKGHGASGSFRMSAPPSKAPKTARQQAVAAKPKKATAVKKSPKKIAKKVKPLVKKPSPKKLKAKAPAKKSKAIKHPRMQLAKAGKAAKKGRK